MPNNSKINKKNSLTITKLRQLIVPILKAHDVRKAGIFGSYARGDNRRKSDIDILVQLSPKQSLLDLVDLEQKLTQKTGKKVDLISYNGISPYLKKQILKEEVKLL